MGSDSYDFLNISATPFKIQKIYVSMCLKKIENKLHQTVYYY